MTEQRKKVNAVFLTAIMVLSVVAMGATLTAGTAVANDGDMPAEADAPLKQGGHYWIGQVLAYEVNHAEDDTSDDWTVQTDTDRLALEIPVEADDDWVLVRTTELSEGVYTLQDADNSNVLGGTFEVNPQSLSAEFDRDVVRNDDGPASETKLELSSNRGTYNLMVSAEGISQSNLYSAFDNPIGLSDDGESVYVKSTQTSMDVEGAISPGEYEINVEVVDTDAEDTANLTVQEPVDGFAELTETFPNEDRGDIAHIPISVEDVDEILLIIGDADDVNYEAHVPIDVDSDAEQVDLLVNTYLAGQSNQEAYDASDIYYVADGGEVDGAEEVKPIPDDRRLESGSYSLDLKIGDDAEAASDDLGTLRINERSTDSLSVSVVNDNYDEVEDLTGASDLDTVATGDYLVVKTEASGIFGYAVKGGSVNTMDDAGENTGVSVTVTQTNPGPHQDADVIKLEDAHTGGYSVVSDAANNRFFLVIDVDAFAEPGEEGTELRVGEEYEIDFTVSGLHNPYVPVGEAEVVSDTFTVVDDEVELDPVEVEGSTDQTISGTTTLAPGNELDVIIESRDENHPFVSSAQVTVQADQTWKATFADTFDGIPEGTQFTIEVIGLSTYVDDHRAEVGAVSTPTPTPTDAPTDTPTDTPTPTDAPTDTPTPTDALTDTPEPTDTDDEETPGFGLIVALLALAGAALLAVRRRAQ